MITIILILSLQILLTSEQLYDEDITFPIPAVILNHSPINSPAFKLLGIINNCTCREDPEDYIVCFGNKCHEFPASLNVETPLFKLKLSMISTIKKHDFIFLHNVVYLEIESNINLVRLEPGCFQDMTKLRNLTISFNENLKYLEENTFQGLTNVGTIILQKNGFTNVLHITHALSSKYVPRIFLLDMSENVFHNIEVDAFFPMNGTDLQQLNMILCEIEYIHPDSLNPLKNLSSLRLGQNLFNTSVIAQLIDNTVNMGIPLDNLNLYDIGLRKRLPQDLLISVGRSNITYLHLTKDNLEQIDDDSFPYMPNLRLLSLRDNLIFDISPFAFRGLTNLECMYIGMNRLSRVPKGLMLKTLVELDLAGNTYDGYRPTMFLIPNGIFANMSNLQNLHMEYNNIGFLTNNTFLGLRNLTKLNLKNTSLYNVEIGTFVLLENLLYLNLNNNPLLSNINLTADLFLGLTNLEILLLGGCSIKNLTIQPSLFSHLPNLKHIGLERNNLHTISPNQLTFLTRLESLSLADNNLSPWNENLLPHGNLKILLANQNKFTYLTNKMLEDWKKLEILDLDVESGLYFPMGDVEVTIPGDKRLSLPLMTLRALRDTGRQPDTGTVNYTHSGSRLLQIDPLSGVLTFSQAVTGERDNGDVTIVAGSVSAIDQEGNFAQTKIRIALDPGQPQPLDCDLITKELCFWKSVRYKLYENRGPTIIGSLSSLYLADLCKGYQLSYRLLNGTAHLAIEESPTSSRQWMLRSSRTFDREMKPGRRTKNPFGVGARVYFGVKCTVSSPTGAQRDIEETLSIDILDENDNLPRPQFGNQILDVYVTDKDNLADQLEKIEKLILTDRDSQDVNNYTVKILNDSLDLFRLNHRTYVDNRVNEHQTVIIYKLTCVPNARIPSPSYTIVLQINDTSHLSENGITTTNVTIRFLTEASELYTTSAPANMRKNMLYPEEEHVFRTAAPLARVTQPRDENTSGIKFRIKQDSSRGSKGSGAFNVTVKGGIVYVKDINKLRKCASPVTLEVQWFDTKLNDTLSDYIDVHVNPDTSCENVSASFNAWNQCSLYRTPKACTKACGLGTGGRSSVEKFIHNGPKRCVWRGEKNPSGRPTALYSTCTPDVTTCPDSKCDPLEELHHLLCPQDCTPHIMWGSHRTKEARLGIQKGSGICTCDVTSKCYCHPGSSTTVSNTTGTAVTTLEPVVSSSTTANLIERVEVNASAHKADILKDTSPCGTPCLIGIAAGSLFLLGAITTIVACWKTSHNGKGNRRDRKYVESVNSINGVHSDYIDRSVPSTETMLLNFDMNTSLNLGQIRPKLIPVVDPKWEFPRVKLHIEQTLGEGEFGRVLRAKALEIAGMPGYTTVAVKTLKEDAREAELADLMSEYQLLKEVSHPNVIRLLGASTLPGGPVYLIIEFAEHGSLRNYLRRSRHLEAEGQTPRSGAMLGECEPSVAPTCKISPRDILSFAWQISKGMSYLNDMKLVHRDLAARNVLLADGMVCKISDFGLTRDVYEDDTYLKRTKGRVPVKWLAPESLADHSYNSKSDVWSFGILLWELVTLGASPYPGVAVQNLFHLLRHGYRMERPDNCSPALYKIMRECWCDEPGERPSFRNLTVKLETMLSDGIDYLDLNPRVVHNRTYFTGIPNNLITPDEIDDFGYGKLSLMQPETVNLLSRPQNETKCAEVDKLQVLWKRPESPKAAANVRSYENEAKVQEPPQELNHYESPIKFRAKADGLQTPTNERPLSYIDMAGATSTDTDKLLRPKSKEEVEQISKVTSL